MYAKIPLTKIAKISIIKTNCKMTLKQVINTYRPNYAINGGLYDMNTGKVSPIPLRIDGKTIATSKDGYWMMAWNVGPDVCMIHSKDMEKWENAVACSTMLKDGNNTIFKYTPAQGGIRGRTAIGNDKDNLHLFVTTDKNGALSPNSLRTKMKTSGCQNAIMLDSGGSSQMYADGKYYQAEKRKVSYWICVWTEEIKPEAPMASKINPYSVPNSTLRQGSKGDGVKWLQWELVSRGFLSEFNTKNQSNIDGIFGSVTKTAVMKFQESLGFKGKDIDGIVGKATKAKL